MTSRYSSVSSISRTPPRARAHGCRELLHLGQRVVAGERGARRGRQAQQVHQRHGAVMAGADRHAFVIENRAQVVRMHALRA